MSVPFTIDGLDHLVLTVADVEASCTFYQRILGMRVIRFGAGRTALGFGTQKVNPHAAGSAIEPRALRPQPGSADLCLLTSASPERVAGHLRACGVEVIEGPVPRTGATGPILSVYFRDPDGNLIEVAQPQPA